jgi:hypothetical protein
MGQSCPVSVATLILPAATVVDVALQDMHVAAFI